MPAAEIMTTSEKFCIELHSSFLSSTECNALYTRIMSDKSHFPHALRTKAGTLSKKRNKTIYGEIPVYTYVYRGKEVHTPIRPWSTFPELKAVCEKVEVASGQKYKTCVIQIYTHGGVGIKPHRDKEMLFGDIIASVSLGVTRVMRFERCGFPTKDYTLEAGTLCLIKPPTNDSWLHSIPTDATTTPRVSLVFR